MVHKVAIFLFVLLQGINCFAQETEQVDKDVLYTRESSFYFSANSNGVGLGYRFGKNKNAFKIRTYDFSFSNIRDLKQVKIVNDYEDAKYFYYGKLNYFYVARVLYGVQKSIAKKPYFGGVEIRTQLMYGLNLGISKPVYLYMFTGNSEIPIKAEKYEENMLQQDIFGSAPFFNYGFSELKFHPGISLKAGLNVEFSTNTQKTKAFEAGFILDGFVYPYQIMALNPKKYYNFSLYLSYHFGKYYNP